MPNIEFTINLYPSLSRIGQHAVAVTGSNEESLVIGHTNNPEKAREVLLSLFNPETIGSWTHNEKMNYSSLKIIVPNGL